jgi:16S rRNA (adenine1518-N6/adenine1519-N6)-dimethyltransferase
VSEAVPLGRAATARLLDEHGIHPRRRLGQHFLVEPNVVRRITEIAAVGPGDRVLEIGAGAGTLTRALAGSGADVLAVEVDERLRPVLDTVLEGLDVDLRFADATRLDLAGLLEGGPWVVVANLPYNVGTPLVLDLLRHAPQVERFVVMLQREAVERLAAGPGSKVYGLPSVVAGIHAEVSVALRVPSSVFLPPPAVESAVALLQRVEAPAEAERAVELAAAAFGQRRKMLRRSLGKVLDDAAAMCRAAGINPVARAEDVSPDEFVRLAVAAS